jgi:hypothetical protein
MHLILTPLLRRVFPSGIAITLSTLLSKSSIYVLPLTFKTNCRTHTEPRERFNVLHSNSYFLWQQKRRREASPAVI